MAKERPTEAATTLGDVLYAACKAPVAEHDWATLVRKVAGGDQLALHELYDRAHRLVFTLAFRITGSRETAEELTIDVFHDVWLRASRYDPDNGSVLGWIMNQARCRAIDRLRFDNRKKRSQSAGLPQPDAPLDGDPSEAIERRQQGASLRAALAALTPGERQAIETAYFGGLTHAETAVQLNQPLGTVKTRIRSALHKLRQALDEGIGA